MVNQIGGSRKTSKGNYPVYEVLLGNGPYDPTTYNADWSVEKQGNIDLYDARWFTNVSITDKLNLIPIASLTFHNLQSEDLPKESILKTATQDTLKDIPIRIYLGGRKKFSGLIIKPERTYQTGEIAISCSGLAEYLHKKTIDTAVEFRNKKSSDILKGYITYPNPMPDPEEPETDIPKLNWVYVLGSPIPRSETPGDLDNDYYLNYQMDTGNLLMHLNNICTLNSWDWYIEEIDATEVGKLPTRYIHIDSERGRFRSKPTIQYEKSAYNANVQLDRDTLKNIIQVSGTASRSSNLETTVSGFYNYLDSDDEVSHEFGELQTTESYLSQPFYEMTQTIINAYSPLGVWPTGTYELYLEDVSNYPESGLVQLGEEVYRYTSKDSTLNQLLLDMTYTTPAPDPDYSGARIHDRVDPGEPVLNVSWLKAYIPASLAKVTKFWIGNELISGVVQNDGIHATSDTSPILRGCKFDADEDGIEDADEEETPMYAHTYGTKILNGTKSLSVPDSKSSIGLYGRNDKKVSGIGVTDRDGLDKYGTSLLLASQEYTSFGSHNIPLNLLNDLQPGDYLNLLEYGATESISKRCMGIVLHEEYAEIQFGQNDEGILNQFDDISKINDKSYTRDKKASTPDILDVSDDGNSVQIYDESLKANRWVPLV